MKAARFPTAKLLDEFDFTARPSGTGKARIISPLMPVKRNAEIFVEYGDYLETSGDKIAEMGSSDADRVKLHFEVRRQGKPVDPTRFLAAR